LGKRKAEVFWAIGRGHASRALPHPLHVPGQKESVQSSDERLQNVPKVTRGSRIRPRNTARRKEHKSRISSSMQCKASRTKSVHICNDSTCPEV
jgi:hypothetical protein